MNIEENTIPVPLRQIHIQDAFWQREIELIRKEVIPYQWKALNNQIKGAPPSYCIRNFEVAARLLERKKRNPEEVQNTYPLNFEYFPKKDEAETERFYGMVFQDSDLYKWIEAASYSLTQQQDEELEKTLEAAVNKICAAQREDGYLDTYYILNNPDKIFTNLAYHHELYCFGHLAEGAAAYYEATGKIELLRAAERYAACIMRHLGTDKGKKRGYPGHEIAELALVRLYKVTKNLEYLKLSCYFIEERGQKPNYFTLEHKNADDAEVVDLIYNQSYKPVREQKKAVGHSVRAAYLYSGMADISRLTSDETLYNACKILWENIMEKKMYITGGIGSTCIGEAFTYDYDLPNDTGYAETCAAIGLVFFARRMLEIKPEAKYADVMERALYNGVLSGMAMDGKSFFYVNPLEVLPEASKSDPGKKHVLPERNQWFTCACCPPNLARLLVSIGQYAFTETERKLYIHLFIGGIIKKQIDGHEIQVEIVSELPNRGKICVEIKETAVPVDMTIAVRIPEWCNQTYEISKTEDKKKTVLNGYLYFIGTWKKGDCVILQMQMEPMFIRANPRVREDIGKIALQRGPIVYCVEEADNGKDLYLLRVNAKWEVNTCAVEIAGKKLCGLKTEAEYLITEKNSKEKLYSMYSEQKLIYGRKIITWIPYYAWANRGAGEMQVWVREKE